MPSLPEPLIQMLRERIADPARRHFGAPRTQHGSTASAAEVSSFLKDGLPPDDGTSPDPFELIRQQMQAWGQPMPEMFLSVDAHGNRSASSDSPDYPLAAPASEEDLARLETRIGRPLPEDLRQMFAIADGGWGPGYAFTAGYGPGLMSASGVIAELDDLDRRGPGYTGEYPWPAHYLPLTDCIGTTAYDLDTGEIVQWDDHWYDHDKTADEAFAVSHPSLQDFLQEWLLD
jgi:hypothetical protein